MIDKNFMEVFRVYSPQIRGTFQPIRNLLLYLQANWQEINMNDIQERDAEFKDGNPYVIHGEFQLVQMNTIFRYIARCFNRQDLLGLTPQQRGKINQFCFKFTESRKKLIKIISQGAVRLWENKENQETIKLQMVKKFIEKQCPIINELLLIFMKGRTWLMRNLTIADFLFYEICFFISNFTMSAIQNHLIYRNILEFKKKFEDQDFYRRNIEQITSKKIFQLKSHDTVLAISNIWEAEKGLIVQN